MIILQKLFTFKIKVKDLLNIYILYIRSILEQSCQVWHYSLTEEDSSDLERVQKVAFKLILGEEYVYNYQALKELNLEKLSDRRTNLCLKFARNCLKFDQTKDMFPLNEQQNHYMRNKDKFVVQFAKHSRLLKSAIPQMQRALNKDAS